MVDNSSFQSLFQLAVALNISFAALSAFFGNTAAKERARLDSLISAASSMVEMAKARNWAPDTFIENQLRAINLRSEIIKVESEVEKNMFGRVRVVAVLSAAFSFGFLVYSSLNAADPASDIVQAASVAVLLPFTYFVIHTMWVAHYRIDPISRERQLLDIAMSDSYSEGPPVASGDKSASIHRAEVVERTGGEPSSGRSNDAERGN